MKAVATLPPFSKTQVFLEALRMPWYIYSALLATTSIIVGLIWDISWHISIGRDAFLSPPHLAIYLGGLLAGIGGGYQMLKTTFAGTKSEKANSVWFWGFRSPLGALFLVWGAIAMLTSAPFDDWWHNAYGLDVEILSPPHALLGAGMLVIQLGSMISLLTYQNHQEQISAPEDTVHLKKVGIVRLMYVYTVGMLVAIIAIIGSEYMDHDLMHSSIFYQVACGVFPLFLIAAGRASKMKCPVTSATAIYMGLCLFLVWFLPLFPAEPKLGPIFTKVTHFVPYHFPILLIVPAIFVDILMKKTEKMNLWLSAILIAFAFFAVLLLTQWFFADFYMSLYARNPIFAADALPYFVRQDYPGRYTFYNWDGNNAALLKGLGFALILCVFFVRIGLIWGNWMRRVQR